MVKTVYTGPRGGKYSDPDHKHAWTPDKEIAATSATTGAAGQLFASALEGLKARHAKAKKAGDKKAAAELGAQIKGATAGQKPRKRFAGGKLVTEYHGGGVAAGSKEHWPHDVPGPSGAFWSALDHLEGHKGEHDDGNKAKARAVTTEAVKVSKRLRSQAAAAQLDRSKAVRLTSLAQQVEEFGKFALHVSGDASKPWPDASGKTKAPRKAPEGQHDMFSGPAPARTAKGPAQGQLGLFGKAQLDLFGGHHKPAKTHHKPAKTHHGPYIGPRGGKWADPQHTKAWKDPTPAAAPVETAEDRKKAVKALERVADQTGWILMDSGGGKPRRYQRNDRTMTIEVGKGTIDLPEGRVMHSGTWTAAAKVAAVYMQKNKRVAGATFKEGDAVEFDHAGDVGWERLSGVVSDVRYGRGWPARPEYRVQPSKGRQKWVEDTRVYKPSVAEEAPAEFAWTNGEVRAVKNLITGKGVYTVGYAGGGTPEAGLAEAREKWPRLLEAGFLEFLPHGDGDGRPHAMVRLTEAGAADWLARYERGSDDPKDVRFRTRKLLDAIGSASPNSRAGGMADEVRAKLTRLELEIGLPPSTEEGVRARVKIPDTWKLKHIAFKDGTSAPRDLEASGKIGDGMAGADGLRLKFDKHGKLDRVVELTKVYRSGQTTETRERKSNNWPTLAAAISGLAENSRRQRARQRLDPVPETAEFVADYMRSIGESRFAPRTTRAADHATLEEFVAAAGPISEVELNEIGDEWEDHQKAQAAKTEARAQFDRQNAVRKQQEAAGKANAKSAAQAFADRLNSKKGGPQARVWQGRTGAPRVYIGGKAGGYVTVGYSGQLDESGLGHMYPGWAKVYKEAKGEHWRHEAAKADAATAAMKGEESAFADYGKPGDVARARSHADRLRDMLPPGANVWQPPGEDSLPRVNIGTQGSRSIQSVRGHMQPADAGYLVVGPTGALSETNAGVRTLHRENLKPEALAQVEAALDAYRARRLTV
jgi:hypothetical protein